VAAAAAAVAAASFARRGDAMKSRFSASRERKSGAGGFRRCADGVRGSGRRGAISVREKREGVFQKYIYLTTTKTTTTTTKNGDSWSIGSI